LAAPYHVLHEVPGAFHGEIGDPCRGVDDILQRGRHLAACFETDLVRARSKLRHGIANVLAAVTGAALWWDRSRCWRIVRRRGCFGTRSRIGHVWSSVS